MSRKTGFTNINAEKLIHYITKTLSVARKICVGFNGKQAVKEFRKERREEKKANRDAFKEETKMQSRNAMNLKKNHNQAIKLV